ncbi:MAG: HesA/MoeB/ThiF family protein [bacterium]
MFTPEELMRYGRHIALPGMGEDGQRRLAKARVLLIGAGGLGSPVALYLAAVGVGHIRIMDADIVEISNLQRQVMYVTADTGKLKAQVMAARMEQMNPHITAEAITERFTGENAEQQLQWCDVAIDAVDNLETRYLLNDTALAAGKPWVHGSVHQFIGQTAFFHPGAGPCYRCLYPDIYAAPSSAVEGIFSPVPGWIGTMQATQALNYLSGANQVPTGILHTINAADMTTRHLKFDIDDDCVCQKTSLPDIAGQA